MEEGQREGYEAGHRKAEEEMGAVYAQKQQECEARTQQAEQEYRRKAEELEPLLVDKISDIFAHVTGVRLENDRSTVLYLLNSTEILLRSRYRTSWTSRMTDSTTGSLSTAS